MSSLTLILAAITVFSFGLGFGAVLGWVSRSPSTAKWLIGECLPRSLRSLADDLEDTDFIEAQDDPRVEIH